MTTKNYRWIATVFVLALGCTAGGEPAASTQNALRSCYEEGDPSCFEDIESPTPDDVFDVCFEEHFACTEAGDFDCEILLDACFDVYDESGDPVDAIAACYADGEECTRAHPEDELCLEGLSICLGTFDDPMTLDDAPDVAEVCFEGHLMCLEAAVDPTECDFLLDECIVVSCPPDHPIEPTDPCIEAIEHCMETAPEGEDPAMCIEIIDGCYGLEPQVPECEEEYFTCLELSDFDSPEECEPVLWACDEPSEPCFDEMGCEEPPSEPPSEPCLDEMGCEEPPSEPPPSEPCLDEMGCEEPPSEPPPSEPGADA